MEDSTKKELQRVTDLCEAMSEEECRKAVNIRFSDWIEENVRDPMAQMVLQNLGPIIGALPMPSGHSTALAPLYFGTPRTEPWKLR